jgi:hypothetical protein
MVDQTIPLQKGYIMAKPDTSAGKTSEVEVLRPYERMVKEMQGIAKLESENGSGFEVASKVIDGILQVEMQNDDVEAFIDDVLDAGNSGPLKVEDIEHQPFVIKEITWLKSAEAFADGGFGTYAVVTAMKVPSLEDLLFTTGATQVVGTLWKFWKAGVFESDKNPTLVVRGRPTPSGTLYRVFRA